MKEEKKSSGMPVALIVGVLVLVVIGAFVLYRSSATPPANKQAQANGTPVPRPTMNTANAPAGATPPNAVGAPTALVVVEEFADFQCGSCAASYPVLKDVLKAYSGNPNFRFVYRNFPLQMHDKAYDAAVAAEAAGLQNSAKFWLMQEQLFTNQATWSVNPNYRDIFAEYAQKIGLDVEKFKADVSGMQAKMRVDQDMARGKALAISSTPTVIVNNKPVPYAEVTVAGMKRIIDAEMQAAVAPQQAAQQPAPVSATANSSNGSK
ncbi:MAG: DsbA family protein [Pyrinomonadaceae bacterium]